MKIFEFALAAGGKGRVAAAPGLRHGAREPRHFIGRTGVRRAGAGIVLAGGLLALASIAHATPLTAETSSVYVNTGAADASGTTYLQLGGGTASVALTPFVTLQAKIGNIYAQFVQATLTYYFEIVGGSAGAQVPVLIATNLLSSAIYPPNASADINVYTGGGTFVAGKAVCTPPGPCSTQFSGTLSLMATAGSEYRVHLSVTAEGINAFASADPYIYIDPSFADARLYSVELSDGVGNGEPSVPTPGTLPLLGSALGLYCLLSRRRNRTGPR